MNKDALPLSVKQRLDREYKRGARIGCLIGVTGVILGDLLYRVGEWWFAL